LQRLSFGEFLLDPARRELWRGGERLSLPLKAFECIAYLVEHRTRAVGRDELVSAVWGRSDVSDNVVDQVMLRARRTLGDMGQERRMIRTVPRFGFAWVAPVVFEPAPAEAPPLPGDASPPARTTASLDAVAATVVRAPPRSLRRTAAITILALAAGVALLAWSGARRLETPSAVETTTGAAHAPLALLLPVTIVGDAHYAWARLGAMELIAGRLRAAGLPMVPGDNVVALVRDAGGGAPDEASVQRYADAAGAGLVLQATATQSGGSWRVALRSVRGYAPTLLVDGESRDVLEAAQVAADRLAARLGLTPPRDGDVLSPRDRALGGLLQQVEAAILADQLDIARTLLDSLDADQAARPDVRFRRARVEFLAGHLDDAQARFEAVLASTAPGDDPLLRARTLNALGNIALRRDDYPGVVRRADDALGVLGNLPASAELGRAYTGRAIALSAQFRFDDAVADFARARVVLESVGDRLGLARVDANLGILDARRDRYAEALPQLEHGADALGAFNDLTSELFARVAAVYSYLALLDPDAALDGEVRLRELAVREPNPQWKRYATIARADVLAANGRLREAGEALRGVLDDAAQAHDDALLGSARIVAARFALDAGDAAAAEREAGAVLETRWEAETPREQAGAWLTFVRARLALGRRDAARSAVAELTAWADGDATPAARFASRLAHAALAEAEGAHAQADADLSAALAQAEDGRVPQDVLQACSAAVDVLLARGDAAQAAAVAARSAAWSTRSYAAALLQARVYHALGRTDAWRIARESAHALAGERTVPAAIDAEPPVEEVR